MSTSARTPDRAPVALVVGMGGLGCPAALALAHAGVRLRLCDDDLVDESNLHRQILYLAADVGRDKLAVARERLLEAGAPEVELAFDRLVPETAQRLLQGVSVVLEGADNFATKFLAADAAHLAQIPTVHGAAVRWHGTVLLTQGAGAPCYRCLFEDLLADDEAPTCSTAGVVGPAVGVIGALMADLALDVLSGDLSRAGSIFSFDGKSGLHRQTSIPHRPSCELCGTHPTILAVAAERYWPRSCATLAAPSPPSP